MRFLDFGVSGGFGVCNGLGFRMVLGCLGLGFRVLG